MGDVTSQSAIWLTPNSDTRMIELRVCDHENHNPIVAKVGTHPFAEEDAEDEGGNHVSLVRHGFRISLANF